MVEPIYCTQCGTGDAECECDDPRDPNGVFCDVCGGEGAACHCDLTHDANGRRINWNEERDDGD